eukprot:gene16798-9597_t
MIALGKLIGKLLGSEPVAPPASTGPELVVVGSCNMDQIAYIPRFPGAGETIHGSKYLDEKWIREEATPYPRYNSGRLATAATI